MENVYLLGEKKRVETAAAWWQNARVLNEKLKIRRHK